MPLPKTFRVRVTYTIKFKKTGQYSGPVNYDSIQEEYDARAAGGKASHELLNTLCKYSGVDEVLLGATRAESVMLDPAEQMAGFDHQENSTEAVATRLKLGGEVILLDTRA